MKKFFLIFIPIILILTYIFYQNNLLPHPKYTNDDFGIQTYKSINDQDHDGIDDQSDIVQNVRKYIETKPQYKSKYYQGGYPTDHYGVCSDVVAFGLLNAGYDLQILVDQDIRENPQSYQVEHPDKNIDFRRVRNLNVYFKRHALSLTLDIYDLDKWQGGDIVIFKKHIGIVSNYRNKKGITFVIPFLGRLPSFLICKSGVPNPFFTLKNSQNVSLPFRLICADHSPSPHSFSRYFVLNFL